MPQYTITAVSPNVRDWDAKQGGPMKSYRVHLKDAQGTVVQNVEWSRRASSPPPEVGQTVEGELEDKGQYGLKLRVTQRGGGGGSRGRDPKERAEIRRQHAQTTALRWAELQHARGRLPDEFGTADLMRLVDHFYADSGAAQ